MVYVGSVRYYLAQLRNMDKDIIHHVLESGKRMVTRGSKILPLKRVIQVNHLDCQS